MHVIDASSPLFGYDATRLAAEGVRIFLSVEARDVTLAATVHDLRAYEPDHIRFAMRYVDAVTLDDRGHPVADLTRVSLLEPDL